MTQTSGLQGAHSYAFLVLLFWFLPETALILVVAVKKRCCLPKTFLLQMIKNSQDGRKPTNLLQVTVMPQLINWKHSGLTWFGWVVSPELQPFVPFDCDSDISKTTKTIRNWGTGKNAFVSGRNAFVSGRNAFVLVQSAVTKIVLPRRPINKR